MIFSLVYQMRSSGSIKDQITPRGSFEIIQNYGIILAQIILNIERLFFLDAHYVVC